MSRSLNLNTRNLFQQSLVAWAGALLLHLIGWFTYAPGDWAFLILLPVMALLLLGCISVASHRRVGETYGFRRWVKSCPPWFIAGLVVLGVYFVALLAAALWLLRDGFPFFEPSDRLYYIRFGSRIIAEIPFGRYDFLMKVVYLLKSSVGVILGAVPVAVLLPIVHRSHRHSSHRHHHRHRH